MQMHRSCVKKYFIISISLFIFLSQTAFSQHAASRQDGGGIVYYATLNEAFNAAGGVSIEEPDEITVLEDIILPTSILMDTTKHIRLVADGNRTIWRGSNNPENPLFRLTGEGATLTLGKPGMEYDLIIDGGHLRNPPIVAHSPLIAVNGLDSKVVMYDRVFIQNNLNEGDAAAADLYRMGAGVFIRSLELMQERQPEFIMKGGTIRGNITNVKVGNKCGGGVYIAGFGLFTMEGGVIAGNTAYTNGGGFHTGSRGSFKKTGGIIYGINAPEHLINRAVNGIGKPPIYGHALCIPVAMPDVLWRTKDGTIYEHEILTFTGGLTGQPGVFGEGEAWQPEIYHPETPFISPAMVAVIIVGSALLAAGIVIAFIFVLRKKRLWNRENALAEDYKERIACLTPREREIFDLLLTGLPTKQIADKLELTHSGTNFHIQNIYRKLGIQSRTELLAKFANKNAKS